jgi:hypothetical protein
LPPGLLIQIISLIMVAWNGGPPATIDDAFVIRFAAIGGVFWIYYLLTTPIAIGFLSLSYLHFFPAPSGERIG